MVRIQMNATRSQPGAGRPFADTDLRRYPELIGQAIAYAINYSGTFEFMQQVQVRALREGSLPLPIARAVLNCMRQDPDVEFFYDDDSDGPLAPVTPLPAYEDQTRREEEARQEAEAQDLHPSGQENAEPTEEEIDEALAHVHPSWKHNLRTRESDLRAWIRMDLKEVGGPHSDLTKRKRDLEVPVKINAPYGMSSFNGKVLHRTSPRDAKASWAIPWRGRWDQRVPQEEDTRQFTMRVTWMCGVVTHDPVLLTERPDETPYCRSGCFSVRCPECQSITHLDPEADPEDKIPACRKCGQEFL